MEYFQVNREEDTRVADLFVPDNPITVQVGHCATPLTFDRNTPLPLETFRGNLLKVTLIGGEFKGVGERLPSHARTMLFNQKVGEACDGKIWVIDPLMGGTLQVFKAFIHTINKPISK